MKILVLDTSEVGQAMACRLVLAGYEVEMRDPQVRSGSDLAPWSEVGKGIGEARNQLSAALMTFEELSRYCDNRFISSEQHFDSGKRHRLARQLPGANGHGEKESMVLDKTLVMTAASAVLARAVDAPAKTTVKKPLSRNHFVNPPDTSHLLLRDMAEAMSDWQTCPEDQADWRMRELLFLQALLPVTVYLEQAGEEVQGAILCELNKLETFLRAALDRHQEKFALVCAQLNRCLAILPQYNALTPGAQRVIPVEHYGHITALMRNLRAQDSSVFSS